MGDDILDPEEKDMDGAAIEGEDADLDGDGLPVDGADDDMAGFGSDEEEV
ncbi:MAG: hypothetical protein WCO03_00785 [bacterium]